MCIKRLLSIICSLFLFIILPKAQPHRYRTLINFPDLPGFITLKCDLHMHTIFSDGLVWPTVRVEEAWREGLDVIALTDHIEYQPHRQDVSQDRNRPYEIARPMGHQLGIIVIKGSEITRSMPPGHLNAIFIKDANSLVKDDWKEVLIEAKKQGAFIFWNHPGWTGQQPDGIARWYKEHDWIVDQGLMHGMEVANDRDLYPTVLGWVLERDMAPIANSDVHPPIHLAFDLYYGEHRPITLVFARERSEDAVKEALFNKRAVAWAQHTLMGHEQYLAPLVVHSISIINPEVVIKERSTVYLQLFNSSSTRYKLRVLKEPIENVNFQKEINLLPGKVALLQIQNTGKARSGTYNVKLPLEVMNAMIGPSRYLRIEIPIKLTILN